MIEEWTITYAVLRLNASLIWERIPRKLAKSRLISLFLRIQSFLDILTPDEVEKDSLIRTRLWIISLSSLRVSMALTSLSFIRALNSRIPSGFSSSFTCRKDSRASVITARKSEIFELVSHKKGQAALIEKAPPHSWIEALHEKPASSSQFSGILRQSLPLHQRQQ